VTAVASNTAHAGEAQRPGESLRSRLRGEPSARTAGRCVVGLFVLSVVFRSALVTVVHAPTVFADELGYTKLAQSIGQAGHPALFNNPGLSYSPLYPLLLSPIYALGVSQATAYGVIKILNAVLLSLAVFPTYKLARFVLPRRLSLLVAGLSLLAPLMLYTSFTTSESAAYPACLFSLWAMLHALRSPSFRADAVLLGSIFVATAARVQLIVLVPVALTAVIVAAVFGRASGEGLARSVGSTIRQHWLLFGVVAAGVLLTGLGSATGLDVLSPLGRYSVVGRSHWPNKWHVLNITMRQLAGLVIATQIVPFVGTLVAAFVFVQSRTRTRNQVVFAAVGASLLVWLVAEVGWDAAVFDTPTGDVPRIHERFLIYLVPLFLIGLFAAFRAVERTSVRVYLVAAGITVLLPVVIPYDTVINFTAGYDSFSFNILARTVRNRLVAIPHATLFAVWVGATVSLLYVYLRTRLRSIVLLLLLGLLSVSVVARSRIQDVSAYPRSLLPSHVDWVDRTRPNADVLLVASRYPATPELETTYFNSSVKRLYTLCRENFGAEFGEESLTVGPHGVVRTASGPLTARYVVAPASLRIQGRVIARNKRGREVLLAPRKGVVTVTARLRNGFPPGCHPRAAR
jgi:hypothetical protein